MPDLSIIPARILQDPEVTFHRLRTLCAIGHFTSRDGSGVWASNATLADVAGIDERDLRRAVPWLVGRGYVRKRARVSAAGGSHTNVLAIVLDGPAEEAGEAPAPAPDAVTPVPSISGGEGEISPPGGRGKSPHPPRGESPHPGRGKSPHQTTQSNDPENDPTASPPPADLAGEFEEPTHRAAYLAIRSARPNPAIFDLALRAVHAPPSGGDAFAWSVIGAGLLEQAGNGEAFNVSRLRGYCRSVRAGAPPARRRSDGAHDAWVGMHIVHVGSQLFEVPTLWALCVEGGLTAPMQTRDMLEARIQELHARQLVDDPAALLAFVLHVQPWTLAEIKFARTREERFLAAIAGWRNPTAAPTQGAA